MRTPVWVASCWRHMILKLMNLELLHAAGNIVNILFTTTASIISTLWKQRLHFFSFLVVFILFFDKSKASFLSKAVLCLCVCVILNCISCWCFEFSFYRYRSSRQKDYSLELQSLPDSEILLRCSTSPSAEAPDFVDNLRRYGPIKINLGLNSFILFYFLISFGLKGRGKGNGIF